MRWCDFEFPFGLQAVLQAFLVKFCKGKEGEEGRRWRRVGSIEGEGEGGRTRRSYATCTCTKVQHGAGAALLLTACLPATIFPLSVRPLPRLASPLSSSNKMVRPIEKIKF